MNDETSLSLAQLKALDLNADPRSFAGLRVKVKGVGRLKWNGHAWEPMTEKLSQSELQALLRNHFGMPAGRIEWVESSNGERSVWLAPTSNKESTNER